ncbi:MAG: phosphatidylglycerol lysyltransferase domain-containing protein [Acidimicrobiales bacterium]
MTVPLAESCIRVQVPFGGRAVLASDLFLEAVPTPASAAAAGELANALAAVEGPGALVVAGNLFRLDIVAAPHGNDHAAAPHGGERAALAVRALEAHAPLRRAIASFLGAPSRRAILLPGTRDRAMCFDEDAAEALSCLGFEIALEAELEVQVAAGWRRVRVEPGWRYDRRNAFGDPADPNDSPLGQHAAVELFPALSASRSGWLEGIDRIQDPAGLGRFIASRLAYRRLGRYLWVLLVPVVVALVARLPELWFFGVPGDLKGVARPLAEVGFTLLLELVAGFALLAVLNHRIWTGPGAALLGPGGDRANDAARDAARRLVAAGYAGLVTGHTLRAELSNLGRGFYANTGACAEVVQEQAAALGMPPVFVHDEQASFVEIEGGAEVHARLCLASKRLPPPTLLERLVSGRRRPALELSVVASYPAGGSFPPVADATRRRRLVRRLAAAVVGLVGAIDLASALVPVKVRGRLHPYLGYVPLGASALAGALDALAGLALLLVARGLRRGQRLAWAVAVIALAGTVVFHILREGQFLEALAALAVLVGLVWARDSFRAGFNQPSVRKGLVTLVAGVGVITSFVTIVLEVGVAVDRDGRSLAWTTAFAAAAERLAGVDTIALPRLVEIFLDPALVAVGLGILGVALLLVFRPMVDRRLGAGGDRRHGSGPASSLDRAREIVARRGGGTLDYFALRSDKQHYFDRDGVIAFAIHSGVCLVSPDPIGPVEERRRLWSGFRGFADEHGWAVAVLGAGEEWLPAYHASGMRSLYIGDEAVVDVRTLSLDGGARKGLRQAVNRIARYGYSISFHDPATLGEPLTTELRAVMELSRRGAVERGFSMTLGRIFDPADRGLLLAVAHDPVGRAVAFCQFVPAPAIEGYSLDLMRRDPAEHPNGLLDFILVRTIGHLKDSGHARLGLNFAMMRAVLADEAGDGIPTRLERFLLKRMSDSMQIESLWRFNAKFGPEWLPRYVAWDSAEQSLSTALAIARAESFWDLPLVGRFLVAGAGAAGGADRAGGAGGAGGAGRADEVPAGVSDGAAGAAGAIGPSRTSGAARARGSARARGWAGVSLPRR